MHVDVKSGLLSAATYFPTEHYNVRQQPYDIQLIVVHAISLPPGQFDGNDVIDFFQGKLEVSRHPYYAQLKGVRVSAHLFIRRDGSICQFVPFHLRAWHAGVSRFSARRDCNDFSIGIELEGTETAPYTEQQYQALNAVVIALGEAYPYLQHVPVVGHSDVAPVRKNDPGLGFCWEKLRVSSRRHKEVC